MEFECDAGLNWCPVPKELADELRVLKSDTGCTYNSVYRGLDPNAQKYLTGGPPGYKHNQAWIYAHYPPGVANPPGRSTHECKNDGVAYPGAVGADLSYWQVGIDVDDGHVQAFIAAARKRGWIVTITYPGSAVEYHHVNFRQEPDFKSFDILKKGDSGKRVKSLVDKLAYIHAPGGGDAYLPDAKGDVFNDQLERAVKAFQKDHHLAVDGVVGKDTWQQILVSERQEKQNRKIDRLKKQLAKVEKDLGDLREARQNAQNANDDDRVKKLTAEITDKAKKADELRKSIRDLGGNPGTA